MENSNITNNEIYKLIQSVLESNESIKLQLEQQKNEIKKEIAELKKSATQEIHDLKSDNLKIQEEVQILRNQIRNIERKSKKYNLVIYGLKEEENENELHVIQNVIELINNKCNVETKFHDIRDFYRIGKKDQNENKHRPLILEFIYQKQLDAIHENSKELKGTGIFISRDFSQEDYRDRKLLHNALKKVRENNLNGKMKKNALYVDDTIYTLEQIKDPDFFKNIFETRQIPIGTQTPITSVQNTNKGQKRKEKETDSEKTPEIPTKRVTRNSNREETEK